MARQRKVVKVYPWQPAAFDQPWAADLYEVGTRIVLEHGSLVRISGPAAMMPSDPCPYHVGIVTYDDWEHEIGGHYFHVFCQGVEQLRLTDQDLVRALGFVGRGPASFVCQPCDALHPGLLDGVIRPYVAEDGSPHHCIVLSPGMMPTTKGWAGK
jgi:hypothetical protein